MLKPRIEDDMTHRMTADATPFDPKRPFRTRDGLEVRDLHYRSSGLYGFVGHWYPFEEDGRFVMTGNCHHLDLVNLPDAPPAEVEDKAETDAQFIDRMAGDGWSNRRLGDRDRLIYLVRRAALVPDAGAVECPACPVEVRDLAACAFNVGANRNVPHRLPEKLDLLAGAVARFQPFVDRHFAHVDSAPPTTPAPASPAGGEVNDPLFRAVFSRVCSQFKNRSLTYQDMEAATTDILEAVRGALPEVPRVRAASPDGEGWRRLAGMRAAGWSVAIHNDYRLAGEQRTFWLFTHQDGRWVKGEGRTDGEAIREAATALRDPTPVPSTDATGGTRMEQDIALRQAAQEVLHRITERGLHDDHFLGDAPCTDLGSAIALLRAALRSDQGGR